MAGDVRARRYSLGMNDALNADQYKLLRLGFEQARADVGAPDIQQASIRTGEAIIWALSLDDALGSIPGYENARSEDPGGRLLTGLKLPRNAVAHGIPITVRHTEGVTFPMTFPVRFKEPQWIRIDTLLASLGQKQNRSAQEIYASDLDGARVTDTLDAVARWVARYDPSVCRQL